MKLQMVILISKPWYGGRKYIEQNCFAVEVMTGS
jgi:hypothetical protein